MSSVCLLPSCFFFGERQGSGILFPSDAVIKLAPPGRPRVMLGKRR